MKLFKEFVDENKELLSSFEPDDGHFERFQKKLAKNQKKNRNLNFKVFLKAAVIVIPLFIASFVLWNNYISENKNNNSLAEVQIPNEIAEIELYFEDEINEKMNEFNKLECFVNENDKNEIINDLKEIDNSISSLTIELQNISGNEKVKNALICNYQAKNELLEKVINQIKENC